MFKKVSKRSCASAIVFALAVTTFGPMQRANAITGAAVGAVPIAIAGAALAGYGILSDFFVSLATQTSGTPLQFRWSLSGIGSIIIGLVMLDAEKSALTFTELSADSAQSYGLTATERDAYNVAIKNGEIEALMQSAIDEFFTKKSKDMHVMADIMKSILPALAPEARSAFYKISLHFVKNAAGK